MSPRRLLAGLGRTLITTGVLLLLFVAYQLWGTGIAEARDQRKGLTTFEAQLAAIGVTPLSRNGTPSPDDPAFDPDPSTVAEPDVSEPDVTEPDVSEPDVTEPIVTATIAAQDPLAPPTAEPSSAPSSTAPVATTSTLPKVRAGRTQMRKPAAGKTLGLLVVPRINVRKVVVEGSDKESLKTGPGHYASTPFPGQSGNAAIACHRTTYGAPCFNLDLLRNGDPIFVQTLQGSFRYEVERTWKVSPKDTTVLAPTPGQNVLTLTTCDPKYSAARRLIVRARLVGPAADSDFFVSPEPVVTTVAPTAVSPTAVPPTLVSPTAPVATLVGDSVAATLPSTAVTLPSTVVPTAVPTTLATADATEPASLSTQIDPGGTGPIWTISWFRGHRSTWISTLAWAMVCAVIWVAAWRFARQRRLPARLLVYGLGFLILFLPTLYLCFENLARLLPENL